MIDYLKSLYGTDILDISIKITLEIVSYIVSSSIGSIFRELKIEKETKKKGKTLKIIFTTIFTASVLFVFGNFLKSFIVDIRLIFGVGILLGAYLPSFTKAFKNGKALVFFVKIFNRDAGETLDKILEEQEEIKK